MSKIFEALRRLERESGSLPSGILVEAQRVLANGSALADASVLEDGSALPGEAPVAEPEIVPLRELEAQTIADTPGELDNHGAVEVPGMPGLDQVPVEHVAITPESRLVYHTDPDSPGADRFRLLRMQLWPLGESGKLKTLLITSAQAQDGKSTIALNLATALAEKGARKVLLLEGDLHHPSLRARLGHRDAPPGLAECLEQQKNPLSYVRRVEPLGFYILPAGVGNSNPTELLQSPYLASVFDALRPRFDWIVVDTAPVMPLTDTLSLRPHSDACLMVMRAGETPKSIVEAAIKRVGSKHIFGLILNGADDVDRLYSAYRRYYRGRKTNN